MSKILRQLAGPVIGTRGSVALGRVTFLAAFGIAVYFWLCRPAEAYPPSLTEILIALMVYNFTSKGFGSLGNLRRKENQCSQDSPD